MDFPAHLVLIGLHSERPRSGKSTVAEAIVGAVGGTVFSIAGEIRATAREMGFHAAANAVGDAKDVPLPQLGGRTPREVLILIGESRTHIHGPGFWLTRLLERIASDAREEGLQVAVIDDVRRLEEGQLLVDCGATVCTLERAGVPDVVDIGGWHSSPSHTFRNDGTPLECAVRIWGRAVRDRRAA